MINFISILFLLGIIIQGDGEHRGGWCCRPK